MATTNKKKVVIPKTDLPPIDITNFTYNVRYRVISDDKNRTSHWSRIHNVDATPTIPSTNFDYSYIKENLTDSTGGMLKSIRFNWIIPTTYNYNFFDVFVKTDATGSDGNYHYHGTAYTNTYVVTKQSDETHVWVTLQAPTYPKELTASAQLFQTASINI